MGSGDGAGSCCAKTILIIVNIFFLLIGLALLAGGILLKFADQLIRPYIDQLSQAIAANGGTNGSGGNIDIDLNSLLGDMAIVFICIGIFVIVIAILGMCGACCSSKCMLITYAVIVFLLLAIQLVVVIIVATGVLTDKIKEELKKSVQTKYVGFDSVEPETFFLTLVMLQFKCCGVDGYQDFQSSTVWKSERNISETRNGVTYYRVFTLETPVACCKMKADFPSVEPVDPYCAVYPNDTVSNWNTGCYKAVGDFFESAYKPAVIGGVTGVMLFELLLGVLAIVISQTGKNKIDSK